MFSWFLKLLGINEEKPAKSTNSLLSASEAQSQAKKQAEKKTPPKTETKSAPEKIIEKPVAPPVELPITKKTSPKKNQSVSDAYPGLKANIIKKLKGAGFTTKEAIDKAKDKELLALKGIGQATIKILRK